MQEEEVEAILRSAYENVNFNNEEIGRLYRVLEGSEEKQEKREAREARSAVAPGDHLNSESFDLKVSAQSVIIVNI